MLGQIRTLGTNRVFMGGCIAVAGLATSTRGTSDKPSIFSPEVAAKSVESHSTGQLLQELAVLRTMRITSLHPVAKGLLNASVRPKVGPLASAVMKPWFQQFCTHGSINDVIETAERRGVAVHRAIVDYATEMITDTVEGETTKEAYIEYLSHPKVQAIAVKATGLARAKAFEDRIEDEMTQARERLLEVCETAQRLGKTVFIDAEHADAEGAIREIAFEMAMQFPGTIVLTLQATRRDAMETLKAWSERAGETPLTIKLVKGAYSDDRKGENPPCWTRFKDTHQQYLALLTLGKNLENVTIIPCTHNPDILRQVAKDGGRAVGNLSGMQIASGLDERLEERVYVIGHDDKGKLVEYLGRRFDEHGEALEPRRELLIKSALLWRWNLFKGSFI